MARYFFNVHDVEPSVDNEGEELPDPEAACERKQQGSLVQSAKTSTAGFVPGKNGRLK